MFSYKSLKKNKFYKLETISSGICNYQRIKENVSIDLAEKIKNSNLYASIIAEQLADIKPPTASIPIQP